MDYLDSISNHQALILTIVVMAWLCLSMLPWAFGTRPFLIKQKETPTCRCLFVGGFVAFVSDYFKAKKLLGSSESTPTIIRIHGYSLVVDCILAVLWIAFCISHFVPK